MSVRDKGKNFVLVGHSGFLHSSDLTGGSFLIYEGDISHTTIMTCKPALQRIFMPSSWGLFQCSIFKCIMLCPFCFVVFQLLHQLRYR